MSTNPIVPITPITPTTRKSHMAEEILGFVQ